jgi:hypothetical protein
VRSLVTPHALAALAVYGFYKLIRRLLPKIRELFSMILKLFRAESADGYTDESESLLSWEYIREQSAKRARAIAAVFKRPVRFDDLRDDRAKVRFVYRRILEENLKKHPRCGFLTPDELLSSEDIQKNTDYRVLERFIGCYKLARYDHRKLPPDAADIARKVLENL